MRRIGGSSYSGGSRQIACRTSAESARKTLMQALADARAAARRGMPARAGKFSENELSYECLKRQ
jgi:hypothetical protein